MPRSGGTVGRPSQTAIWRLLADRNVLTCAPLSGRAFNKAVRTLMKLNGSTAVDFSALDAEFSALQSSSAELRTQLETLQPDISALKNIRKYIDMVLNKQQLSAPGGKTPEKESVLKKLEEAKAAQSQKKTEQKNHTQEL